MKFVNQNDPFVNKIYKEGKLIGLEFADEGIPGFGTAYYKWSAYKYKGDLFILEIVGFDLPEGKTYPEATIKLVNVTGTENELL